MKKIVLISAFIIAAFTLHAQQKFMLEVQPGKEKLDGDGDDYTTIVITARNADGEIMTGVSGKVQVRVSAGLPDEFDLNMNSGVALVKYTAPMFGTPVNASQRMIYFLFRFMQKFIARSAGSTNTVANQKLATDVALETMKEGLNPLTLIPKKEGDNFAYIVAEMNGIKGKAKIEIGKAVDGPNGSIIPGMYYGHDITGQSYWYLDITSGGEGSFGEASGSSEAANTILFTTETFTEFNDVMGKMAGMGGFMKAYLGPPESEVKYVENYNIREMGMSSAYMPMPKNGVFVYVPPILFEYAGRKETTTVPGSDEEKPKSEKTGIIFSQDKIIGDGRSRTKAVFHFEDENGRPVEGKNINWNFPGGLKVISSQTVTGAGGNAEAVLEAPVLKAGNETRGENTGELIDNYDIYKVTAGYTSAKNEKESTMACLCIYKTLEQNLYILKPGMEPFPYKVLLPQLEYYNLESSIYVQVPQNILTTPLNEAIIFVESRKFDREYFRRIYDTYFKKDQAMFMTMLENEKGGYSARTDRQGKFKLIIRDFEGKRRLATGGYDRKMTLEPMQAKIADLTGRRSGALTEVLGLLSAGADASGNTAPNNGTYSGMAVSSLNYKEKVMNQLLDMERVMCTGSFTEAMYLEEKLHIIGLLMTNAKGTSRFMDDTGGELIENGWTLLGMVWDYANEYFKITDKLGKKVGYDKVADSLTRIGIKIDVGIWSKLKGVDQKYGTKRIIVDFIRKNVLASDAPNKLKASTAYYRMMGQAADALSGYIFEQLTEGISDALSEANPVPDYIKAKLRNRFYAGLRGEVDKFLAQPPAKVHGVYEQLYPSLRDRSTEIRSYYQDIASSRFNWEMYKADWDLFRDVVVKGAIIIYDVKTLNWAKVKDHFKNLEDFNKATDLAYTGTRFGQELWRYKNLWCEARAAFDFANRSIEQGALVSLNDAGSPGFSLFPAAVAATAVSRSPVSGLAGLDFSLRNGAFPVKEINSAIEANLSYEQWINSDALRRQYLTGSNPDLARDLYRSAYDFDRQLSLLLVNALAYAEEPSAANRSAYKASASALEQSGKSLSQSGSSSGEAMDKMPDVLPVNLPDVPEKGKPALYNDPLYLYVGGGVVLLAAMAVVFMLVRKRRSGNKKAAQPVAPYPCPALPPAQPPVPPVVPASPVSTPAYHADAPQAHEKPGSVKFCPQCGTPFTPGKRFCGKCGFKAS